MKPASRTMEYQPAMSLNDDDGKALLEELETLWLAITHDASGKKVRQGSDAERWAVAALHTAILQAAARFRRHEDFTGWVLENGLDYVEAYDPIRGRDEQARAIEDLRFEVKVLREKVENLATLLSMMALARQGVEGE
jgi:hypothetical protein